MTQSPVKVKKGKWDKENYEILMFLFVQFLALLTEIAGSRVKCNRKEKDSESLQCSISRVSHYSLFLNSPHKQVFNIFNMQNFLNGSWLTEATLLEVHNLISAIFNHRSHSLEPITEAIMPCK